MKTKFCHVCRKAYNLMYRVKLDRTKKWYFLCKTCTEENKSKNSNYVYGGTWKG